MKILWLFFFIGFLDGDGYFDIGPQKQYNKKTKEETRSTIRIRLGTNVHKKDIETLKYFQKTLGFGTIDNKGLDQVRLLFYKEDIITKIIPLIKKYNLEFLVHNRRVQYNLLVVFLIIIYSSGIFVEPSAFFCNALITETFSFIGVSYQEGVLALIPALVYTNVESNKKIILSDNKSKAGIYQWSHIESGKIYIGSAVDLSSRLRLYFFKSYLNRYKNLYIYNALLSHGHSKFSLTILEYIDISNLSKDEIKSKILLREQHYIDDFSKRGLLMYNILKIAGSRFGTVLTEKDKQIISAKTKEALADLKIRAKMSENKKGGDLPLFGKTHSPATKAKMSEAKKKVLNIPVLVKILLLSIEQK